MKKKIIDYYALLMMILFIIYNQVLGNLKIGGLLYQIFMISLIIINIMILVWYKERIKYKGLVILIYFLIWLIFSKNTLQCLFALSNMIALIIIGFMENNVVKILTVFIGLFFMIFSVPLFLIFLFAYGIDMNEEVGRKDIYEESHYYCENHYEIYSYSAGAMDKYHYSIGKYYEFLNIDGIIYISYNERNEVSRDEYNKYLNTNNCRLVGDNNGTK